MHAYIYKKQIVENELLKRESEREGVTDLLWILMILRCTVIVVVDCLFAANS